MGEKNAIGEREQGHPLENVPSIAAPATQEAFVEKLPASQTSDAESGPKMEKLSKQETEPEYPSLRRVIPIVAALYMCFFLVALDRTIIATAVPRITDEFHSLGDVGWYGSAYMLTGCSFLLLMGRVYTFYNPKKVFLSCIVLFEIGSAISGAAPNSTCFIVGRAIAGSGSSGIFSGAIVIFMYLVPLHKRPVLQSLVGGVFGIASVAGPLLGGLFTDKVSWRWCFYINLPIGAVAIAIMVVILKIPAAKAADTPWRDQVKQLDPLGTIFFIASIVCLLLALQWGGSTYPWNDGRIIALLVLFILFLAIFVFIQLWKPDTATIPPRIVKNRSIVAAMWTQFMVGASMMIVLFYIPIWFQAIKAVSAVHSGIDTLPIILALVVASITAGALVQRLGYYVPFMIANSIIMSLGAGLITTLSPDTGHAKWIGYQIIFGYGLGIGMQQGTLAAQAVLPRKDAPTGLALVMFMQQLGGALFVSIGDNVFTNELVSRLKNVAGIEPSVVVKTGATQLRNVVDPSDIKAVVSAYNDSLDKLFTVALALSCLSILGSASMKWVNIKPKPGQKGGPPLKGGPAEIDAEKGKIEATDEEKNTVNGQVKEKAGV